MTGAGWSVWVEQPLAEAFAPIYGALWRTGILLIGGAALAAALAYLLARRMTGPIKLLEQGAEQIGAGNFRHRIAIATGDELERLAGRFNEMVDELAAARVRFARISRLRQFLAPQVAELVEQAGQASLLDTHRVEVAVIFCDLRNFTAFSARAEPDEIMGVLGEYYSVLGPIIASHEATQTSFAGDGLMMLLNAPLACPEPAVRAVKMAMDMRTAVRELALAWRVRGHAIGFGIGIAKGPATVGSVGHENRLDYTAIGSVVNLASRLCSTARDGQILVDPRAAEEVGSEVPLECLGRLPLKGFDEQVLVYAVAEEPAPAVRQGRFGNLACSTVRPAPRRPGWRGNDGARPGCRWRRRSRTVADGVPGARPAAWSAPGPWRGRRRLCRTG